MPYILKKYYPLRNIVFFVGEGALIFLSISFVYLFYWGPDIFFTGIKLFTLRALLVTLIFQLCLYYFDLYDLREIPSFTDTATRITQAFGIGCIALAGLYYLFPITIIPTGVFWYSYFAICIAVACGRALYSYLLGRRMFTRPILLMGTGDLAADIAAEIENRNDSGYKIAAYSGRGKPRFILKDIPFIQDAGQYLKICKENKIEKIVVALDDRRGAMPVRELLICKLNGIHIDMGISFYEGLTGKLLVEKVNPSWLIFSQGFNKSRKTNSAKRAMDVVLSSCGLLASLPISIFSALVIKLESPGPVLYAQKRVGLKEKYFNVLKFRSMQADAEKEGPVWALQNDTRVTRFGSFIRKVRIDEIPQMWNVLRGDMSFVGPRPERPVFVKELEKKIPYYALRNNVKPGITGWAQVFYPYGASEEDALRKLEYDLYYIKNMSLAMDILIIFQTIKTVLFQKGAR